MKKILLVEDDSFIIDIYSNAFKRAGYKVDIAHDGEIALAKIKSNRPDLLVLDINLPKMNGWDVMAEVRGNPSTQDLKVIVISNLNEKENSNDIAHYKILKYFLKIQTAPEELTKAIKEIL